MRKSVGISNDPWGLSQLDCFIFNENMFDVHCKLMKKMKVSNGSSDKHRLINKANTKKNQLKSQKPSTLLLQKL